jgi:hypothetical protein
MNDDAYTHLDVADVAPDIDGATVLERAKARGDAILQKREPVLDIREAKETPIAAEIQAANKDKKRAQLLELCKPIDVKKKLQPIEMIAGSYSLAGICLCWRPKPGAKKRY